MCDHCRYTHPFPLFSSPDFRQPIISFERIFFFPELTNQCWRKGTTVKHVIRWRCQNPSVCNPSPCNLSACSLSPCNPWHRRSNREILPPSSLSLRISLQILTELNEQSEKLVNEPYLQFAAGISTPIRRVAARGGRPAATGCVAGT